MEMSACQKGWVALIARVIVGVIFIAAGWMKVAAMAATIGYFAQTGIPAFFAYVVGYAELIGGVFLVLGLWTCLTSAVLSVIMIFAVGYTYKGGFQVYMTPLITLAALLGVKASGDMGWSLCRGKKGGEMTQ